MSEFSFSLLTAIWLGVLTSISPCPLATNITAVTFLGRRVNNSYAVFGGGLLYSLGRALVYVIIASLVAKGMLAIPQVSTFLQKYMNQFIGPILILVGMFLLELITIESSGKRINWLTRMAHGIEQGKVTGMWAALLLGVLFALSFCPISAALYFGSLIPMTIKNKSLFILPFLFGLGTALPVILFSMTISFSAKKIGTFFNKLTQFEIWARRLTGILFIIVGLYFISIYVFELF